MTPHNITNSANNLKITELALYNIVEFQAFGSRPLRPMIKVEFQPSTFIFFNSAYTQLFYYAPH